MYLVDASSIIHAWDNYPIQQFPGFWSWIQGQIESKELGFPKKAYDEVRGKTPECFLWIRELDPHVEQVTSVVLLEAARIKTLLNILDDNYHSKGVGENDIIIIATAKVYGYPLISNEGVQGLVQVPSKRKIPAVCRMEEVDVECVNILAYIKSNGGVF